MGKLAKFSLSVVAAEGMVSIHGLHLASSFVRQGPEEFREGKDKVRQRHGAGSHNILDDLQPQHCDQRKILWGT